ncbi:MAG TPA: hypothetical protein VGX23_22430 [Actinocrinis sp.]|nr:hypothetical protein [Actinocrinis sp.]
MADTYRRDSDAERADAERELLAAAREGRLAQYLHEHADRGRTALYRLVSELVYERTTRPNERRRGHDLCAASLAKLGPDCHDKHQDDVEAVFLHVLRHQDLHFENLPGWLVPRLGPVTVDAHRRRRGERGALQRPRLPGWLADELGQDPWLRRLVVNILDWVGVTATAATGLWPLGAWAQQRALAYGEPECSEARVAQDVERVLAAMRRRPAWFAEYVERPLGRKQPPLAADQGGEPDYVAGARPDEVADSLLAQLAWAAIEALDAQLKQGAPLRAAVLAVLGEVFGRDSGAAEMDRAPGGGPGARERAAQLILEPQVLDRVVDAVIAIIEDGDR